MHPHLARRPDGQHGGPVLAPKHGSGGTPADEPGEFTVKDFASLYDVNPLYAKGINGSGRTIGILTFASFRPSDAIAYWQYAGVKVKPNRLTIVNVDSGPGAPSDVSGSDETTADVEQSGGVAPDANIIVYQAPNTSQGTVDVFARMIHDNRADSFSISWGIWELFDNLATSPVNDAFSGQVVSELQATHELLVIAALQGQTGFASSGDTGAYDAFGYEGGNFNPLSVDYPATDTAITAAGGTTIAFTATFTSPAITITVPHERVWGWDYLEPLCPTGQSVQQCFVYPAGDGGGVSLFFAMPSYQFGISGTQSSQPRQTYDNPYSEPVVNFGVLPAFFPGRNVPDVSFNADPFTGYILAFTSDGTSTAEGIPAGFSFIAGFGGTSFVGPQLNGVTALLGQNVDHRLGLLNTSLYNLAREGYTFGPSPVIRTISSGNNWFYYGRNGYSPAAGLGTIDVYNLSRVTH
jgi:subtilase family serine protease